MITHSEAAERIGGYVWLEERLFEVLGGWVRDVPAPAVKVQLATDSGQHAWRASRWRERLPRLREMPAEALVRPSRPELPAFVSVLAGAGNTLERVVGAYRVALPRLVVTYARHFGETASVSDGPTARALELALADALAQWRRGEAAVQSLLHDAGDVERAAVYQGRLESTLVASPGI